MDLSLPFLVIDLSTSHVTRQVIPDSYLEQYLGGVGLAVRLLWEFCPVGPDALRPENPIVFAASTLGGTLIPPPASTPLLPSRP